MEHADRQRGQDHGDQDAGNPVETLEQQYDGQAGCPHCQAVRVGLAIGNRPGQFPQLAQRTGILDRDGEQLRQLADQYGQRNPIHIAVADGLRQQFCDEPKAQQPQHDAEQPGNDGHQAGGGDGARGIAGGSGDDDGEDRRRQRGIRPQHQDPARTEQRIGQQGDDGRVQAVHAGHARCLGIGDADRHQHRGQHQSGSKIPGKPRRLIGREGYQSGQPAPP
ncbi:hypothetical protein D3C87_1268820 [compost metagenome]